MIVTYWRHSLSFGHRRNSFGISENMKLPQTAKDWFVAAARSRIFGTCMPKERITGERSGRKYLKQALKGPTLVNWYSGNQLIREGKAPGYFDPQLERRRKKHEEFKAYVASGKKLKQSQIRKQNKSRTGRKKATAASSKAAAGGSKKKK